MSETVAQIIESIGNDGDKILEVLLKLQHESEQNYLSVQDLKEVSRLLDISLTKVYGIAEFYSMLSTKPRGKYVIQICDSPTCHIKNSKNVVEIFENILGIRMGEVTEDHMFSLEYTSCIGMCDHSPAAMINDRAYGDLDRGKIFNMLAALKRGEEI